MSAFKFGQRVRNKHASVTNPIRDGYFVEMKIRTGRLNPGKWCRITDGKGTFWETPPEALEVLEENP